MSGGGGTAAARLAGGLLADALQELETADAAAALLARARGAVEDAMLPPSPDVTEACRVTLGAILAAEVLKEAASSVEKALRAKLADALDAGPGVVQTETHTATTSAARRAVAITGDVPADWMIAPPPVPDKKRIEVALARGEALSFAVLSNGGAPSLSIRSRRKT